MGKLRTVNVSFQMESNKIIDFSVVRHSPRKRMYAMNVEQESEPIYGYAGDIAFLSLYANEISKIKIPTIMYSEIAKSQEYTAWVDSISQLKGSVNFWNDNVLPKIYAIPDSMMLDTKDIKDNIKSAKQDVNRILKHISKEMYEDVVKDIEKLKVHIEDIIENTGNQTNHLQKFFDILGEYKKKLIDQNAQLIDLTTKTAKLTDKQKAQMDDIQEQIDSYESSRKLYIAGASVTGILAGAAIGGGIATCILLPGVGICIGIACFFGASILGTGMGICIEKAIELKKMIENEMANKSNVDKEKTAIVAMGNDFSKFVKEIGKLEGAIKDIIKNWNGVSQALQNITTKVSELNASIDEQKEWTKINNDIAALEEITGSLDEAIDTMDIKTKIYIGCDLTGSNNKEEIMKKLQEYVEQAQENEHTA